MAKDFILEYDHSKRYVKSNKSEPTIEEYVFGCISIIGVIIASTQRVIRDFKS